MSSVLGILKKILGLFGNLGGAIPVVGPILKILPLLSELIGFLGDLRKDWRSGWEDDEDFDVFLRETKKMVEEIRKTRKITEVQAQRLNKLKNFVDN